MRKVLKNWVTKYTYQSATWKDFQTVFTDFVIATEKVPYDILSKIPWDDWINRPYYTNDTYAKGILSDVLKE